MLELYAHQKELLDRNPPKHLICFGTGLGKTLTSMELAQKNECATVLVICPKSLKEKWIRDWNGHFHKGFPVGQNHYWSPAMNVLTKEEFSKNWNSLIKYDAIIVDEAHYFSGRTSAMSKNLMKYIRKYNPPFVWLLTATPYMSTPWNIYTLARFIGHEWSYVGFEEKFFTHKYVGQRLIPVVKDGVEEDVARLVKAIGTTAKMEDCFDVPEQLIYPEYIPLTSAQEKTIKRLSQEETLPIVRFTKIHQVENGILKGDGYVEDDIIDDLKTERIKAIVLANPKVAVFCRYTLQIEALKNAIESDKDLKGKKVYVIQGETKHKDALVQEVDACSDCVVIINSACSEGYELPSIPIIVFASLSFSYKDYEQGKGRFLRANKLKKNIYIHLVTTTEKHDGVDEAVYASIMKKQDFSLAIYSENI